MSAKDRTLDFILRNKEKLLRPAPIRYNIVENRRRMEPMEYRTLGADLKVSAVGLGCMGMSHAYGPPADEREMTRLLH